MYVYMYMFTYMCLCHVLSKVLDIRTCTVHAYVCIIFFFKLYVALCWHTCIDYLNFSSNFVLCSMYSTVTLAKNDNLQQVRLAERSKAPDSRVNLAWWCGLWAFWSSYEGVGSNPTPDKCFFVRVLFLLRRKWRLGNLNSLIIHQKWPF